MLDTLRHNFSRTSLAAVTIAGAAFLSAGPVAAQKAITIGTSSVGSSFYVVSVGISKMAQKHADMNVSVEAVGGSHANMFAIAKNKVDFAIANSGASFGRYHGDPPFKKPFEVRLVSQGHPTLRWLIVRKGSGISEPGDLAGKTISSIRRPLPELKMGMDAMIKTFDLPADEIKQVASSSSSEVARQLRAGTVDGAFMPFAFRMPMIVKLFRDDVVRPFILSDSDYGKVKSSLPDMFFKIEVPANNYQNQPEAFPVLGLNAALVTSADMDDETVYKLLASFMDHQEDFRRFHGAAKFWNPERALKEPKIPFHPGAIKYFKDRGLWEETHASLQKDLLSR